MQKMFTRIVRIQCMYVKRIKDVNQDKTRLRQIHFQMFEDCLKQEAVFCHPSSPPPHRKRQNLNQTK